jgi:hypothetical protein
MHTMFFYPLANFHDINWVVVSLASSGGIENFRVLPCLRDRPIVPNVALVREAVSNKPKVEENFFIFLWSYRWIDTHLPKLFFLNILLDGVQHFLQANLKNPPNKKVYLFI